MSRVVKASRAADALKEMLLGPGGSATVQFGNRTRMLSHSFLDRPMQKLPWPLRSFQAHDIRYAEFEEEPGRVRFGAGRKLDEQVFSKGQVDKAIEVFLSGTKPDDQVLISPEGETEIVFDE